MTRIDLSLMIMPDERPEPKQGKCLYDRACEWITDVENESDNGHAWHMLVSAFNKLKVLKTKSEAQSELFKLIQPIIKKYGRMSSEKANTDIDEALDVEDDE